jgi:hypothetical protein
MCALPLTIVLSLSLIDQGTILRSHVFQILAKETLFLDEEVTDMMT